MKPERLRRTFELLTELGTLQAGNIQVIEARMASPDELALFHRAEYIDGIKRRYGELREQRQSQQKTRKLIALAAVEVGEEAKSVWPEATQQHHSD